MHQTKMLLKAKEIINSVKRQPMQWQLIFANIQGIPTTQQQKTKQNKNPSK